LRIRLRFRGEEKEFEIKEGTRIKDILPQEWKEALVARSEEGVVDFHTPIKEGEYELLDFSTPEGKEAFWHTTAHILAQAVKRLFPARLGIGPAIEQGFYYDFEVENPFVPEDMERIECEMRKIVEEDLPLERKAVTKKEARRIFEERGEKFKLELIEEMEGEITIYRQGEFVDLCKGPHVLSTGMIKSLKILSFSSAYWRGDEKRESLQRVYGISFPKKEELEEFLKNYEEAKKRDHRKLGKELDIFGFYPEVGPGLLLWHPKGAKIRRIIEEFWIEEHEKRGYNLVYTPHIARGELWRISGHMDYYRENMYVFKIGEEEYVIKPMNCPFHILIYKSKKRSYRDLPLRYAELGTVYRYERSGVLHGAIRVRGFTQDDGHIFCTPEQIEDEIKNTIDFVLFMMRTFGYHEYRIALSVRDPKNKEKYAGSDEEWEMAENALKKALEEMGLPYRVEEGEAVFYGPKIDMKLKDALGRYHQGPTIQFDFNLPRRFNVTYMGPDGKEHYVYMVHRALLGSFERFIGGLIEHYAGDFPLWLSPVQARIMTITDENIPYAARIFERMKKEGIRVELDKRSEKIGYKIREAELEKIPYMIIIGRKEMEEGKVSVRRRKKGDMGSFGVEEVIEMIKKEVKDSKEAQG